MIFQPSSVDTPESTEDFDWRKRAGMRSSTLGLVFLVGCASARATPSQPAGAPQTPSSTRSAAIDAGDDLGGDADFRDVASKAQASDPGTARARLEGFLVHHPHHHQRPAAVAMLAAVMLAMGDAASAKPLLVDNGSFLPATDRDLLMGLCESQLGHFTQALALLRPYLATDPPRMTGLADTSSRAWLRLTLADSLAAVGDPAGAIDQLELYLQIDPGVEAERAFALQRAEAIATKVSETDALQAQGARHGALARACLGPKAVVALRSRGDEAGAGKLDQETSAIRKQLGMEVSKPWAVVADPLRLGLAVPFSGTQARLGDAVLRGAMLVVTTTPNAAQSIPFRLLMRDVAASADRSTQGGGPSGAIAELARQEKAIGVVSTPDARAVDLAKGDGLPLLLLDERATGAGSSAFPILHSSEARAAALARTALGLGARRFAILGPDNAAGKRLAAAYKSAVQAGGGTVTGHITYAPTATSFSADVASLRKLPFDALFIPDDASRLELIAPALAVAEVWPRSPRQFSTAAREASASGSGRREALLLSTALGLSGKFLHNVERYVQGALLCPGFYPSEDMRSTSFVTRFRESYGAQPSATDAYAYDAVSVLRGAVERGARTRADVLRVLATQTFEGLTGDIRFGLDHSRIDSPLIYVVDGDSIRMWK
jgi:ABC-type branched-subunit amino acid transport system substrate-binding protein